MSTLTGPPSATSDRNGLYLACAFGVDGRIRTKTERYGNYRFDYTYDFDSEGHLTSVVRDGHVVEVYAYNRNGQRIYQNRNAPLRVKETDGNLLYNREGHLIAAGEYRYAYNEYGALAGRSMPRGTRYFSYGDDTMLESCRFGNGERITFEYDPETRINPVRRSRNGNLTTEYRWKNPLQLAFCRDHEQNLDFEFFYRDTGMLDRVRLTPHRRPSYGERTWLTEALEESRLAAFDGLFNNDHSPVDLMCGCDQVGTVKVLTLRNGRPYKTMVYDSFGVLLLDNKPELFMPIGFAGGLSDPDTGLVRFGYRDYDPLVGRFTAPDPLGDTGGDHDLYDYCVDDPVTMNDPSGLIPPLVAAALGITGALGVGVGVPYGGAALADLIEGKRKGKPSSKGRDAVASIAPKAAAATAAAFGASAIPVAAAMAPTIIAAGGAASQATATVAQRVGAAIRASKHGEKIDKVAQFVEPILVPGPPTVPSYPSLAGATLNELIEWHKKNKKRESR